MKKLIVFVAMIFAFSAPAFAWNDVGHKLTGYIAWQRLTPDARTKILVIMSKAPEDSGLAALYPQDSRSTEIKQREFFMYATYWADIVRDRNFPMRNKYHRSDWHYADTFWKLENGIATIIPNPNEEGGKAVIQLAESEKTLRSPTATDSEKAIALAWFLHLGGDIHQPLHTSARVTELEPKGDQGGNFFSLTPKDTPRENQTNLHWYWDSIVNRAVERKNDAPDGAFLPPLGDKMMKRHPFGKYASILGLSAYDDWQKQSFAIAMREVFPESLKRETMPGKAYLKNSYNIAEAQIALAGYRMGETLNRIFGTSK